MDTDWKIRDLEYTVIPELQRNIRDLRETIDALKTRIFQLEEKERTRSREDHDREISFDEQAIRDGRFYDDRLDER